MEKYKITIRSNGDINPEFDLDEALKAGMDVDGFLLLTFKNGDPYATSLMGCTTFEIARAIASDMSEGGSAIRQAAAIAEGLQKAKEIYKKDNMNSVAKELAEMLRAK